MASKKLEQAISQNSIILKGAITGEVKLIIKGKEYFLNKCSPPLNVSALLKKPQEALSISGLQEALKRGFVILV